MLSSPKHILSSGNADPGIRYKLLEYQPIHRCSQRKTHNWNPSITITAIVPSCEMHKRHPRSGLCFSSRNLTTLFKGVVKIVHRAQRANVLEKLSVGICCQGNQTHSVAQNAIEPSSPPPITKRSRVLLFCTTPCSPVTPPFIGAVEVLWIVVGDAAHNEARDV